VTLAPSGIVVGQTPSVAFSSTLFQKVRNSTVLIDATDCNSASREGTGFIWLQLDQIATALHVVAGCKTITVKSESTSAQRKGRIGKLLVGPDLALIILDSKLTGMDPMSFATSTPSDTDELQVIGYPEGIPKMNNTHLRLRSGGLKLRDNVPKFVSDKLDVSKSPDPDLEFTSIEGHLLPGLSGAPIVNANGELVAIGDGGLDDGMTGISWAIPVLRLNDLATSPDTLAQIPVQLVPQLFAAEKTLTSGFTVSCGNDIFRKTRTVGPDIVQSSDDPNGLLVLANGGGIDFSQARWDVYQHKESGATFVVPADAAISSTNGMCIATSSDGTKTLRIASRSSGPLLNAPGTAPNNVFVAAQQFEMATLGQFGWGVDPRWSYNAPQPRFDGLLVTRKMLLHYLPGFPPNAPQVDAEVFETLASRNGNFLGVSALESPHNFAMLDARIACRMNPSNLPNCAAILADATEWAQFVLSAHLSTFPIG
jgi:hypothetical protein